jgi:hypothetical protein
VVLNTVRMSHEQTSVLMPLGEGLDPSNRWVKLARLVPWEMAEAAYGKRFRGDRGGQRPLSARVALGALIIRERLSLTDRETVAQIGKIRICSISWGMRRFRARSRLMRR